jgi:hypothetical protein
MAKKGMLGSGSKGTTRNPNLKGIGGSGAPVGLDPSQNMQYGGQLPAEQRANAAMAGRMLSKQLKKNKSGKSP